MTKSILPKEQVEIPELQPWQLKSIFFLVMDYQGCGWYRSHVPGVSLKKRGHDVVLDHFIHSNDIQIYDIINFHKSNDKAGFDLISYANSIGKFTVYDLDDNIWFLDRNNPGFQHWNQKHIQEGAEMCIKACQAVTTTTKDLANYIRKFNKNVHIIPNMLPQEHWEGIKHVWRDDGKVIIGWAGSVSHWSDLKILTGTIEQIVDEYENTEFHIAGMPQFPFKPHPRIKQLPVINVEDYGRLLASFDIALAPLTDSIFNKGKSDLKFLEYSMAGVPIISSKVGPYIDSIEHGVTGLLARNPKDWIKNLRRMIENEDLRKEIAQNAYEYAQTRTMDKNIWLWEKAFGIY